MNVMTPAWRVGWILIVFLVLACGARAAMPGEPVGFRGGVDVYVFWREGCPHCERALA